MINRAASCERLLLGSPFGSLRKVLLKRWTHSERSFLSNQRDALRERFLSFGLAKTGGPHKKDLRVVKFGGRGGGGVIIRGALIL